MLLTTKNFSILINQKFNILKPSPFLLFWKGILYLNFFLFYYGFKKKNL